MSAIPVYSIVLVSNHGFTGVATFEVPSSFTCVVRDIDVVAGISVGGLAFAYGSDGAQFAANNFGTVTEDYSLWSWRGRQVFPGPDLIHFQTDFECDIRASGYLLSGVGP